MCKKGIVSTRMFSCLNNCGNIGFVVVDLTGLSFNKKGKNYFNIVTIEYF